MTSEGGRYRFCRKGFRLCFPGQSSEFVNCSENESRRLAIDLFIDDRNRQKIMEDATLTRTKERGRDTVRPDPEVSFPTGCTLRNYFGTAPGAAFEQESIVRFAHLFQLVKVLLGSGNLVRCRLLAYPKPNGDGSSPRS